MSLKAFFLSESNKRTHWKHYRLEAGGQLPEFVIVSAADTLDHGPETYIFEADEKGEVTNWMDLPGSFIGGMDHEAALRDAGYEVASS